MLLPRSADIGTRLHRTGLGFNQVIGPNSRVLGPADPDRVAGSGGLRTCPRDGPMIFDGLIRTRALGSRTIRIPITVANSHQKAQTPVLRRIRKRSRVNEVRLRPISSAVGGPAS